MLRIILLTSHLLFRLPFGIMITGKKKDADLAIAHNRNLTKEEYLTAQIA